MPITNALIGVQTRDLPTLKVVGVEGAALNVAALCIKSERGVLTPQLVRKFPDFQEIYGNYMPSYYGAYCVQGVFENAEEVPVELWIRRILGADADPATADIDNSAANAVWTVDAGRRAEADPGVWANGSLGILVIASSRAASTLTAATSATSPMIALASVSEFEVGDVLKIGAGAVYGVIASIDEVNNTVTLAANVGSVVAIGGAVAVQDRTVKVYRKDLATGIPTLVEQWNNVTVISTSPFYTGRTINNVDSGSLFIKITHNTTAEAGLATDLPVAVADDIANIVYLAGGTDGTALTETEQAALLSEMPQATLVGNTETFTESFIDLLEEAAYDNTNGKQIVIGTPDKTTAATLAAALSWTKKRLISRRKHLLANNTWYRVDDPIGIGTFPKKEIPSIGHIMGFAVHELVARGFHKVPATRRRPIKGIRALVNPFNKPSEFTPLADYGLNVTTENSGEFFVRSARVPSKLAEWKFFNSIFMMIYFKRTFETDNSFIELENEMDTETILGTVQTKIKDFSLVIYNGSTNGGSESGFARFRKPDGSLTSFTDVVKIDVSEKLNPVDDVMNGIVKANFYFMAPPPAERIIIGVGLLFNIA